MAKRRREISLDDDVAAVLEEKTEMGEICTSRYINNHFREKFSNELKEKKTAKRTN
jgi:hypothetical protein